MGTDGARRRNPYSAGAGVVGPKALVTIGDFVATGVTLVVVGGVLVAAGKYRAGFPVKKYLNCEQFGTYSRPQDRVQSK
jgi:hypothetical protein